MIRNLLVVALVAMACAACSKGMSQDTFIDTMASIGCAGMAEGSPEAEKILKEKGVTEEQIQNFRTHMDPSKAMEIASEISKRVAACYGVKLEQPAQAQGAGQ